jgi:uncharacterized protein (TIGR00369 family)
MLAEGMTQNEELIRYMEQQVPFNRVLGIEIMAIEEGSVIMRVPMKPEFIGDPVRPAVHGGVISALADTVAGLAVFRCIEWGRAASTVDLRVDYLRPVPPHGAQRVSCTSVDGISNY